MKNYSQPGKTLSYVNSTGVAIVSGQMVVVAGLGAGIACGDIAIDATGELSFEGVYSYPKVAATAIAQGDELYLDVSEDELVVALGAGNVFVGVAAHAALSADTEVYVKLGNSKAMSQAANQADVATADGYDAATTQALANALKVAHNALLAKLKASGIMVAD